jgi:hypothetical protein
LRRPALIAKANPEAPNMDERDDPKLDDPKLDAIAVRAAMAAAGKHDVVKTFLKLAATQADLDEVETEMLRNEAARRSGTRKRIITQMLQEARHELAAKRQYEAQERALAERKLPRPRFDVPSKDVPAQSVMAILDEVVGYPILRDSEGRITHASKIHLPPVHAFSKEDEPAWGLWFIHRMSVEECAELIEHYVEFVDKDGRSVRLPTKFVRLYLKTRTR